MDSTSTGTCWICSEAPTITSVARKAQYWIDARFTGIKPQGSFRPTPNEKTFTDFAKYEQAVRDYNQNARVIVDRTPPNGFTPRLADIDAMIATLTIQRDGTSEPERSDRTPTAVRITPTRPPTAASIRAPTATPISTPESIAVPHNAVTLDSRAMIRSWNRARASSSGSTCATAVHTLAWTKEHYGFRRTGQWAGQSPAGMRWRDVAPGEALSFSEQVTAPTTPGAYSYGFVMQHDGLDFGPEFAIKVAVQEAASAKDDAQPAAGCSYHEVTPGAKFQMTYTIRNAGTST